MIELGDTLTSATAHLTFGETYGKQVEVTELIHGDTVFYFFPAAFTGVCTKSSCELRDSLSDYQELGVNVYGVSPDMPASQRVFAAQNNINYPLLSDWNKELIAAFDNTDHNFGTFKGVPKRSLYLFRDGKLAFKWEGEHAGKYPPFDELKETLKRS